MDKLFESRLAASGQTIACRAGCSFCCYIKVDAHPLEVFTVIESLKVRHDKQVIDAVLAEAVANRDKLRGMSAEQQLNSNTKCPLLKAGCCLVYSDRPAVCRKHHARDVAGCERLFHNPSADVPDGSVPEVTLALATASIATTQVFKEEGYDARPYDLSSALAEALVNPKCYKRWRDKKKAFSDDIVAKDWDPNNEFKLPLPRN